MRLKIPIYCVQRTNIQNLKAIHNRRIIQVCLWRIVFKERIYKIWKQFTTISGFSVYFPQLCSKNEYTKSESNSQPAVSASSAYVNCVQRTNIQNLKAIHNKWCITPSKCVIVFKERIYKIWKQFTTPPPLPYLLAILCSKNEYTKSESNSQQPLAGGLAPPDCVQRTNIQNLKAIHNSPAGLTSSPHIVFKERIYKIWKQFTTIRETKTNLYRWLCSKNEYTKSESNSQPFCSVHSHEPIVFKERIYKIWKQFTTGT